MASFELLDNEVVLHECEAICELYEGEVELTVTSHKLVVEKSKGIITTTYELVDVIFLDTVKWYNNVAQIKQKGSSVDIQTIAKNFTLTFSNIFAARKFAGKMIDATTGTTLAKRGAEKVKGAIDLVDDTLEIDTRGTIKSVVQNGLVTSLLKGTGKKK